MGTGKAAVLKSAKGPFEIMEFEVPDVPAGSALVKTEVSGICGTDVHIWDGELVRHLPRILGHEVVGTLVTLGAGLDTDAVNTPVAIGDRVIAITGGTGCGHCYYCLMGDGTVCEQAATLRPSGPPPPFPSSPFFTGGFAEYFFVKSGRQFVKLPPRVSTEAASVFACGGPTITHALDHDPIRLGETVVVQGAGPVGLYGVLSSKLSGAYVVICIGAPAARLEVARWLGADHVLNIDELRDSGQRLKRVRDWTGGIGPDIVLDCTGFPAAAAEGLEMVRRGGRFFVIGQYSERGTVPIRPEVITFGEVRIQGSRGFSGQDVFRYLRAMEIAAGTHDLGKVISHRFELSQATEALSAVKRSEPVRAVFTF